jgi:hypothetical protein
MTICAVVLSCSTTQIAQAPPEADQKPGRPSLLLRPLDALLDAHTAEYTHYDGPRCPMYPSCAAYAKRALREEGLLGLMLFVNRLFFAETGDLSARYLVAPRRLSGDPRYYNPLTDDLGISPSLWQEEFP